jgi:3-methyladenine DNA glycosylase/8-oxoguanine DNA glycosylase
VATRTFTTQAGPVDLARTLFPLRRGTGDPTTRIFDKHAWRTMRSPAGAATLHLRADGGRIHAEAWGPGAAWVLEMAPDLVGADDVGEGFEPHHELIARLWRAHRGVRLTRTHTIVPLLIAAIFEQKVTGIEARRAWRGLVRATSEPAPGPLGDLQLPPDPARVAAMPAFAFHRFGVEARRADVIRAVCSRSTRFETLADLEPAVVRERLRAQRGIGVWTAAETTRLALGDPDAVSVGDYHLSNLVAWALAGEPRGTDERMLELLEPYRGQRARVQQLLEVSGLHAPRYGPRTEIRSIAGI